MRYLLIDNKKIATDLFTIIQDIKNNIFNGKLAYFREDGSNIKVTCPIHKNGQEKKPSAFIYIGDDDKIDYGTFHCFACGHKAPFYHFVAECFDKSDDWAKAWLINNYAEDSFEESTLDLKEITLSPNKKEYLNENILESFESFHPYMSERKLSRDVCKRFDVRYDPKTSCIVFPVRDENGHLVMLTRRSVINKSFIIDKEKEKPVYLLYYLKRKNIDSCFVTESQINCLTCQSYGLPAIAMLGTGSQHQYDVLNKSPIRYYVLCFDGDAAGKAGAERFLKNIRKDVIVDILEMPPGKDVNDLSKDEFFKLLDKNFIPYRKIQKDYNCELLRF